MVEDAVWGEPVSSFCQPVDTLAAVDKAAVDEAAVDAAGPQSNNVSSTYRESYPSHVRLSYVASLNRVRNVDSYIL
jgi:hypothetical protein